MCRLPVTFGGGMTMEYGACPGSGRTWKRCVESHISVQRASTAAGSKRVRSFNGGWLWGMSAGSSVMTFSSGPCPISEITK